MWLMCNIYDNYVYLKGVPADTDLEEDFTVSNIQPNIQRYSFIFVNIVDMEVVYVALNEKHHLC